MMAIDETIQSHPRTAAIVLVHYGSPEWTVRCLESLASTETYPHLAIVVDHGPEPGLGDALQGLHPSLTVVSNFANPGFGSGCNLGARKAFEMGAEAVWFLNNDAIITQPTLQPLMEQTKARPEIALWGTHQINGRRYQGTDAQACWFHRGLNAVVTEPIQGARILKPSETLGGASILVTRESWEKLGSWPEHLFLYWEDVAWCRRAHEMGMALAISDLNITHRSSRTVGKRNPMQAFYSARNRLILHREYHPSKCLERLWIAFYLFQMRFFQGRPDLWKATWNGIRAASRGLTGRDPRY